MKEYLRKVDKDKVKILLAVSFDDTKMDNHYSETEEIWFELSKKRLNEVIEMAIQEDIEKADGIYNNKTIQWFRTFNDDSYLVELFNEDIKNLLLDYYSCEKEDLIEAIKDAYDWEE